MNLQLAVSLARIGSEFGFGGNHQTQYTETDYNNDPLLIEWRDNATTKPTWGEVIAAWEAYMEQPITPTLEDLLAETQAQLQLAQARIDDLDSLLAAIVAESQM